MKIKKIIDLICLIIPIIAIIVCLLSKYAILSFLPAIFIMLYLVFLRNIDKTNLSFTYYLVVIFSFIRLVISPLAISVSGDMYIDNVRIGRGNINSAILHLIYEFTWVCLVFFIVSKFKFFKKKDMVKDYQLFGSIIVYFLFIVSSIGMFFVFEEVRNSISIFIIKSQSKERIDENLDIYFILIRQFIIIALNITFIIFSWLFYKKYKVRQNIKYIVFPLLLGIINISVIIGERRSLQVYTLIITVYVLSILFKKHSKVLIFNLLTVGIIILVGMTIYKEFYAFAYGGYSEAIKANLNNGDLELSDRLQAYFYGLHNVSANLDLTKYQHLTPFQVVYDFLRSIIGSSLFMNTSKPLTTQIFNQTLFGPTIQTGQLFSSVGYGSIFFGFLLSPLFTVINLFMCIVFENLLRNTKYIEFIYLLSFIVLRISFNVFSSPPPIINQITLFAIPFLLVILIAGFTKKIIKVR
ncbi:hypothetical protein [Macrococcus equi]|uniref:hypothetical protein n=1 Tax=Macrococcus equi TaxID=3395462 RepID=UPI0039BE0EE0